MDDSGAILCQISSLKDMLDQVNEEIEANIQITREIESEVVKCSEFESELALRESELTKTKCAAEFEMNSLVQVSTIARVSLELLEKELNCLRVKRDEALKRMTHKRETFIRQCSDFQRDISKGENEELWKLLSEKEVLENENQNLNVKVSSLRNSMSAFVEEILEELHTSNSGIRIPLVSVPKMVGAPNSWALPVMTLHLYFPSPRACAPKTSTLGRFVVSFRTTRRFDVQGALYVEIRRGNMENKKLLEDIEDLKTSLIATSAFENHPRNQRAGYT